MKKVVVSKERRTREYMANPHMNTNLDERLKNQAVLNITKINRLQI